MYNKNLPIIKGNQGFNFYRRFDEVVDILVNGSVNESAALDTEAGNFERISLQRTGHVFSEFGQKSKEIGFQFIICRLHIEERGQKH